MIRKRKSKDGVRYDPQVWDPRAGRRVGAKTLLGEPGTYARRKDAERVERRMKDAVDQAATPTEDRGPTVGGWVERWLTDYPRPKESTNLSNRYALRRFLEGEHKDLPLVDFTRDMARMIGLENAATARVAQACWNDAIYLAEILEKNPWVRLKLPPANRRRLALTEEEVLELANLAPRVLGQRYGVVMRGLIIFAAYSGLRVGELCAMRWDWVDGDTLWVARNLSKQGVETSCKHRTEGDPPQPIAIVAPAAEALRSIPRSLTGYVWTLPTGRRMEHVGLHGHWSKVRAAFLGRDRDPRRQQQLEELVFHSLRHTTATLLAERGFDRWAVMSQMRHRDPSMVDGVYTHIDESKARQRMVEAFAKSETVTSTVTREAESR